MTSYNLDENILAVIVCPSCKSSLEVKQNQLLCSACNETYELIEGVPVLLRKELVDFSLPTDDAGILIKRQEIELFNGMYGDSKLRDQYLQSIQGGSQQNAPDVKRYGELFFPWVDSLQKKSSILNLGGLSGDYLCEKGFSRNHIQLDISAIWGVANKREKKQLFVVGDVEALPFASHSFDVLLVQSVLHHLPNQEKALTEIKRVLKPNGKVFISEPAKWSVALIYYLIKRAVFYFGGIEMLRSKLGYYGSATESFVAPSLIRRIFDSRTYEVKIEKSYPFRLPYS